MKRIFFDTETTGLWTNPTLPLDKQPFIVELGVIVCDQNYNIEEEWSALVKPPIPMPIEASKISGITDENLLHAQSFAQVLPELRLRFLGATTMLAHYAVFDFMMLQFELRRLGQEFYFPWCSEIIDTRDHLKESLEKAANRLLGPQPAQAHRALDDCRLLRDTFLKHIRG